MISPELRAFSAGMLRTGLLLLLLASTSAVQREETCNDSLLRGPCASRRRLAELQQGQQQQLRSLASSVQDQPALPPPLYDKVLDLEAAQSHGSRGPCPIDRLLVTDATPGFDSYLLMLQAGLTVGAHVSSCSLCQPRCRAAGVPRSRPEAQLAVLLDSTQPPPRPLLRAAARLTRRTFIVPSVVELHGRQITMRDMLDVKELKNFW